MSGWVIASGLAGAILGAFVKWWADIHTARRNRLLDEKLKHAVKFLETADRLRRTSASRLAAAMTLDDARHDDEEALKGLRADYEARRGEVADAFTQSEDAYNVLRLLVPAAASAARLYLDYCRTAEHHPDEERSAREQARETVEQRIREAIGM